MVHLPSELVERLDQRAAKEGVSRSQVIRDAVTAYLAADQDEAVAAAYENGYGKVPFGTPDAWGDVEAFHEALARERGSEGLP